MLLQKNINWLW